MDLDRSPCRRVAGRLSRTGLMSMRTRSGCRSSADRTVGSPSCVSRPRWCRPRLRMGPKLARTRAWSSLSRTRMLTCLPLRPDRVARTRKPPAGLGGAATSSPRCGATRSPCRPTRARHRDLRSDGTRRRRGSRHRGRTACTGHHSARRFRTCRFASGGRPTTTRPRSCTGTRASGTPRTRLIDPAWREPPGKLTESASGGIGRPVA